MIKRLCLIASVVAVVAGLLVNGPVYAAPSQGPDPSDFTESNRYGNSYSGWGRTVDYAVATSAYNTILTNVLNIYMPTSSGTIVVHNMNICYATWRNGGRNYDQLDDGVINSSGNAVSYQINGQTQWGAFDGSGTCDSKTISFNVSGASLDPNTNMYKYQMVVTANPATDKYTNTYWVTAPAGSYVGQDSSQPTSAFGMEQTSPIPGGDNPTNTQDPPDPYKDYSNYLIRFAPDCSLTTASTGKSIEIFDDDNSGNWDVQPRPFLVKLVEIDNISGATTNVPLSFSFPDGYGQLSGPDGSGYYTAATTANAKRIIINFTVKQGKKYQWLVDSVYYDNTLQFKIPYDSVYYYQQCQLPGAKLKAGMTASPSTMSQEDTATFAPSISASNFRATMTVTCSITRTFYPASGGSSNLGNQPCTDNSGNSNITVTGNGTIDLADNTYSSPTTAVPGSKICDTITITNPTASQYYASPGDNTSTSCVTITKTPSVSFLGGDVWAGGGFASLGTCTTAGKITTAAPSSPLSDGTYAGSGVAYSAFALDQITNFGSGSWPLVGTSGDNWTFSNNNTSALGFYGASPHCITDYSNLYATATTLSGSQTVDVSTKGSGVWHVTGGLTVHGTMPAGAEQVYIVDQDVDIDANLQYPASYTSVNDIPSLVIIGKHNLHVWSAATQVDGIYEVVGDGSTTGFFRTCWPKSEPATISTCPTTVTINGAVLDANTDFFRTAGATGGTPALRRTPAEVFNLPSEVYINNALNLTTGTTITTNNVRELPPRF